ncbi:hypothetical protein [Delftia sp.]|uniref:hypothetical protein n=1 Tax=Delftia sp. TaxID=1886637 RepID=UPI00257E018B|nr:hypothetical protein [Delftia sp.]MPT55002.1 hypothetical protein [Delftia sp.]
MPYFKVEAYARMTMLIKADDAEQAGELALDEAQWAMGNDSGAEPPVLLETEESIAQCRRHADQILGD